MKKLIALVSAFVVLISSFASPVFAASPKTLSGNEESTITSALHVTNPDPDKGAHSTFDKNFYISGYGDEGITVTVFVKKGGEYKRYGTYAQTIGASGLFSVSVPLVEGSSGNDFIIRGEDAQGNVEYVHVNLVLLSPLLLKLRQGVSLDLNVVSKAIAQLVRN